MSRRPEQNSARNRIYDTDLYSSIRDFSLPPADSAGLTAEQLQFPDPAEPSDYDRRIADLGGADVCYAGLGINGHMAFNGPEPALRGAVRTTPEVARRPEFALK
jgi:6-phosphogluconolactonase/glucosamine-6-phosphate isomerase/deaminase